MRHLDYTGKELYDEANGRYIAVIRKHFSDWSCRTYEVDDDGYEINSTDALFTTSELHHFKIR